MNEQWINDTCMMFQNTFKDINMTTVRNILTLALMNQKKMKKMNGKKTRLIDFGALKKEGRKERGVATRDTAERKTARAGKAGLGETGRGGRNELRH